MPKFFTSAEKTEFRKSPQWRFFRLWFIAYKGNRCDYCGMVYNDDKKLNVHHIYYNMDYNILKQSRYKLLCRTCHDFIHLKYNSPALKGQGWLVKGNEEQERVSKNA